MVTPSYTITCTRNEQLTRDVYEIKFSKPEGFDFKPGQFILFDTPLVDDPNDIQPRAFSIASTPAEEELLFVVKVIPNGRASRWVLEVLREGSEVRFTGALGLFLLNEVTENDYLFICTGTGIAPFRSQIITALERGDTRRMDLIFGTYAEEDLFWTKEFSKLTQTYDNFFIHYALDEATEDWKGHHGRVQTLIPKIVKDFSHIRTE